MRVGQPAKEPHHEACSAGACRPAVAGPRRLLRPWTPDRLPAGVAESEAAGAQALAVSMDVSDEASVIAGYDAAGIAPLLRRRLSKAG